MNNPTRKNAGAHPLTPRATVSNSAPSRPRGGGRRYKRAARAGRPLEWAVGNLWDVDFVLWARLHLPEHTWKNVEQIAECEGVTVEEILSRFIDDAGEQMKGGAR